MLSYIVIYYSKSTCYNYLFYFIFENLIYAYNEIRLYVSLLPPPVLPMSPQHAPPNFMSLILLFIYFKFF